MSSQIEQSLLERMVGRWVLRGTIARESVVHDVQADWVLDHRYVRLHEVSREKKDGRPEYEAMVFVARNDQGRCSCVWLDVFGGLSIQSIGVASEKENELQFLFRKENGEVDLTNTFRYSPDNDAWEWWIDNVENGVPREFARVRLTRS